jgi:hypothetical protein
MPSSLPTTRHSTPQTVATSLPCRAGEGPAATATEAGPIRERIARSLAADLVGLQVAPRDAGRLGLGVDPDPLGVEAQHSHVGLDVPLAVQQCGVLTLARAEGLDVIRQLSLQVLGGVGAGDEQLAARRAVEQAALLAQLPVLGVQLDWHRLSHGPKSKKLSRWGRSG